MKRLHKLLFCLILISIISQFFVKEAFAYLDPGSGSYMLQLLLSGLLGFVFLVKMKWRRIKTFILGIWEKLNGHKEKT